MHLIDTEVLDLTRQLSPALNVLALLVGLLLWLMGAYGHRFWMAITVTAGAGVAGLYVGPGYGVQPLVAALLLALSAGVLCLALARIGLFLAGGLAALVLLRAAGLEWNEFVCFVVGGLAGVCLYRLWVMVVSSLVGALLVSYALLSLSDGMGWLDAVSWSSRNAPLLNWGVGVGVLGGAVIQFVMDRRRNGKKQATRAAKKKKESAPPPAPPPPPPPPPKSWWQQIGGYLTDRAA
jgi:hypothetical protein